MWLREREKKKGRLDVHVRCAMSIENRNKKPQAMFNLY